MTQCPKCSSQSIDEGFINDDTGYNYYTSKKRSGFFSFFGYVRAQMHVCTQCGYGELFVDPEKLRKKLK